MNLCTADCSVACVQWLLLGKGKPMLAMHAAQDAYKRHGNVSIYVCPVLARSAAARQHGLQPGMPCGTLSRARLCLQANWLKAQGIKRGDAVAIYMPMTCKPLCSNQEFATAGEGFALLTCEMVTMAQACCLKRSLKGHFVHASPA